MAHASTTRKTKSNARPKAAKSIISTKAINLVEKKAKKPVSEPQIKQAKAKPANTKTNAKSQKSEKSSSVKKSNTVAPKKKTAATKSLPFAKTNSKKIPQTKASAVNKNSAKLQPKDSARKSKSVKTLKVEAQKKVVSAKFNVSIKKKTTSAKSLPVVSIEKNSNKIKKTAAKIEPKAAAKKTVKVPAVLTTAKKNKTVKVPTILKAKKSVLPQAKAANKKAKSVKVQTKAPSKKLGTETAKSKAAISPKTVKSNFSKIVVDKKKKKTKPAEEFGINARKYSLLRKEKPQLQSENPKTAGKEIKQSANDVSALDKIINDKNLGKDFEAANGKKNNERKNTPSAAAVVEQELAVSKSKKKKARAISAAVFRGKKERYDFEVFPIEAEFEDVPAIYIISKRKIDKRKRAHHALVCIGQTDSLVAELKKHRKGKCVKKFAANSISLLREENEKQRLKIEIDLKAAHAIPCIHS